MTNLLDYFPKDKTPRPEQIDLCQQINAALLTDKKFILVNAATGFGKSCVAAAIAAASKGIDKGYYNYVNSYRGFTKGNEDEGDQYEDSGTAVLTVTKALQNQYEEDFDDVHTFKGKSNYQCNYDPDYDVEEAPCNQSTKLRKECWDCGRCDYYEARNQALASKFGLYNYDSFLRIPHHIKRREYIVCDEASELEGVLVNTFSYTITYEKIGKLLGEEFQKLTDDDNQRLSYDWLAKLATAFVDLVENLKPIIADKKHKGRKKAIKLTKLLMREMEEIRNVFKNWALDGSLNDSTDYIVECLKPDKFKPDTLEGVSFTPLRVNKLSRHLFKYGGKVFLVSATMIDPEFFCRNIGIDKDNYIYIEKSSAFDPKNAPIYFSGDYPLNFANLNKNLPKVTDMAKQILEKHKDDKGLIHTVNFKITRFLENELDGARYIFRGPSFTNQKLLAEHTESTLPTVMVSPSMSHGVDLKGDLGKFQIVMKVPYLPLGNKRIKKLAKIDPRWYINQTLQVVVQMCGRINRTKEDIGVTYILDGSIKRILEENLDKFPKYFRDRIK
jgi:ATP-dependent DNA helicase DinG